MVSVLLTAAFNKSALDFARREEFRRGK
jgi:hypothetical protein